jgi:tetratricopeptide (TPR) repeat protein
MSLKRIFLSLALVVALCGISYAWDLIAKEVAVHYNAGVRAQKSADYDSAHAEYTKALLMEQHSRDFLKIIYNNLGVLSLQRQDTAKAQEYLEQALSIDPNYKNARFNLWLVCEARGDTAGALENWAKAFDLDKAKPREYVIKGENVPWSRPKDSGYQQFVLNGIGILYGLRSQNSLAEESFKEALAIDPDYKPAQMNLGLMCEAKKDRANALEYWAKAFDIDRHKPREFVMTDGHFVAPAGEKGPEAKNQIPWTDPKDPNYQKFVLNNMGIVNATRADMAAAEASFKEALKIDPKYVPALLNLGLIYEMKKDRSGALEYWLKAFNFEQLKPKAFVIDCRRPSDEKEAGGKNRIPWTDPKDPNYQKFILNNMAVLYALRGDMDKAEEGCQESLKIDPKYRPALLNLGLIYEKKNDRIRSLEYWARVFQKDSRKPRELVIEGERQIKPDESTAGRWGYESELW